MSGRRTYYLEEYNLLRAELTETFKERNTILLTTVGAVGAILSYSITQGGKGLIIRASLTILATCVIFFSNMLICERLARVWRITIYMRTFLEPNLEGLTWESRLQELYKKAYQSPTPLRDLVKVGYNTLMEDWASSKVYTLWMNHRPFGGRKNIKDEGQRDAVSAGLPENDQKRRGLAATFEFMFGKESELWTALIYRTESHIMVFLYVTCLGNIGIAIMTAPSEAWKNPSIAGVFLTLSVILFCAVGIRSVLLTFKFLQRNGRLQKELESGWKKVDEDELTPAG